MKMERDLGRACAKMLLEDSGGISRSKRKRGKKMSSQLGAGASFAAVIPTI